MKPALTIAGVFALVCAGYLCIECALAVREWRALPDQLLMLTSEQLAAAQGIVDHRLASLEAKTDAQLTATRGEVLARVDALIEHADARTGEALNLVDVRTGETLALLDTRTGEITKTVEGIAADTEKTVQATTRVVESTERLTRSIEPWLDCGSDEPGQGKDCMQRKFWWMTIKADSAMTELAKAAPKLAEASDQTARATAETAQNIAVMTRPGPRWMRYVGLGLSIAVPAAQIATPFVLGAVVGK